MKKLFSLLLTITLVLGFGTNQALADTAAIDFEGYAIGSIHGQDGWSSSGAFDHKVVNPQDFGYTAWGSRSLRISNAVTSGSFGDQTFSRSLIDEAGELGALDNGLSGGTRQPHFEAQWIFASTVPNAEQPGLSVVASPDRGDGARMSWVQMVDTPAGLAVNFYDVQGTANPANFVGPTPIAGGLDRSVAHTIKLSMDFFDGPSNDVVKIYVDGTLRHTGTSWENYYIFDPESQAEGIGSRTVDSLLFRTGGAAAPATLGKGFLIDNLTLSSGPIPPPECTDVCYVDASNGNDANGGASVGNAKKTIQAAIDAVNAGGEVRVLPGNYDEKATNRYVLGTNGPHQFGLFIDKDDITIQGVTATDQPIVDKDAPDAPYIITNATNNFGASGIFVQGDGVTLAGLHIGPNTPGDNKTIEIIGNGFTLKDSHVDVPGGGSVYLGDWRYNSATNTSYIQSYTITNNLIDQSTSIDIANGAGYSGGLTGRQITNNVFENADYWPSISFNGSETGVEWYVQSVGGAVIQDNTFTNTFNGTDVRAGHIRTRGVVDLNQFDWESYWTDNTFNKAVVILESAPFNVRQYNYTSGSYSFDVRRIGVNIQGSIDKAVAGDTVLVKDGTYAESPNINKALTLKSWAGRDVTTIQLQSGPTYLGALTLNGINVTVDGFTITGLDGTATTLASSNIYVTSLPASVDIRNNRIQVGQIGASSNGDDGFGLLTTYNPSGVVDVSATDNIFEPVNAAGTRAFYINPGVDQFTFFGNEINGKFLRTAMTQAKVGLVEDNTLTGVGSANNRSAGFGTWGYPDASIFGHTTFKNNTITGVGKGIAVFATDDVVVENNFFLDNDVSIWIGDFSTPFDPASLSINENSIVNSSLLGVQNASTFTGTVNAETNWWGSNLASDVAADVNGSADYDPWLCSGTDTSTDPGFQPTGQTDCSGPLVTDVSVTPSPVYLNAVTTLNAVADDAASNIASAEYKLNGGGWLPMLATDGAFDELHEELTATFTTTHLGSNQLCVRAADSWSNVSSETCVSFTVGYVFTGFFQPIDMNAPNLAKAGQTIPVKWRLTDAVGAPISDPSVFVGFNWQNVGCSTTAGVPDAIENYSASSGLQYLGDGYWQFNWKTLKGYANSCYAIHVQFTGGLESPVANFKFKP